MKGHNQISPKKNDFIFKTETSVLKAGANWSFF